MGTYNELMEHKKEFFSLITKHVKTSDVPEKKEMENQEKQDNLTKNENKKDSKLMTLEDRLIIFFF